MSPKAKSWLWMLAVIISRNLGSNLDLKMFDNSEGITKTLLLGLIIVLFILFVIIHYLVQLKNIPVGLAYATWSGTGILVVSTLGMAFYLGQHPDTAAIIGMAVIASGIVIMNLFSENGFRRRVRRNDGVIKYKNRLYRQ